MKTSKTFKLRSEHKIFERPKYAKSIGKSIKTRGACTFFRLKWGYFDIFCNKLDEKIFSVELLREV